MGLDSAYCREEQGIPTNYRLLDLYRAAREDGDNPDPDLENYQSGETRGFGDAFSAIVELVKPTSLAKHIDPQYTCGYYDGVARALRQWADGIQADQLIPEEVTEIATEQDIGSDVVCLITRLRCLESAPMKNRGESTDVRSPTQQTADPVCIETERIASVG